MKKLVYLFALPPMLLLFGCPVGVDFAPGTPGKEKIDAAIIGTWQTAISDDIEFKKAVVTKFDDYSYDITVSETGGLYELDEKNFTGWVTEIDAQKILYIYSPSKKSYYTYAYKIKNSKALEIYDISLLVGGIEAVTSTEAYRAEISASLKKPECLNDAKLYVKL